MRKTALILCALLLAGAARGEEDGHAQQIAWEVMRYFAKQDYDSALKACTQWTTLAPDDPSARYDRACALARLGRKDEALAELNKSAELGFTDSGHMEEDADLETLHGDGRFAEAVRKSAAAEKAGWPAVEKGVEIKGLKLVEGECAKGFPYRVRMSPMADANNPARLAVWLHPAGASGNDAAETLSGVLVKHGFALLVVAQKNFKDWTNADLKRLYVTLAEAGKIDGINAAKPVLVGWGIGGQLALQLWYRDPKRYTALILDAAYPVNLAAYMQGRPALLALPKDDNIKHVPLFVLVGQKDSGVEVWKNVEAAWGNAGVPLTIRYVPNQGAGWLIGKDEITILDKWIQDKVLPVTFKLDPGSL